MSSKFRGFAGILAALTIMLGCATVDGPGVERGAGAAAPVEAPVYRVGDRWVYRVTSAFRATPPYEETHTVTAIGSDGITVAVAVRGPQLAVDRTERWPAPGLVTQGALFDVETRRFREPLQRYRFPLQPRAHWNQFVTNFNDQLNREGIINHYVRVQGYDRVTTPAGTFDAIRMDVIMRLDDEEFWRWPTDCTNTVWYASAVKNSVREVRRCDYMEKGSGAEAMRLPSQNSTIELLSFTPGR
jgi:hypothetical protein